MHVRATILTNNMHHQAQQLLSMTKYDDFSVGLQRKGDVLYIQNYSAHSLSLHLQSFKVFTKHQR